MKMTLVMKVSIEDCEPDNVFRFSAYGLPVGLGLIDVIRKEAPGVVYEDMHVDDWALVNDGARVPSFGSIHQDDKWIIPLSEAYARESGQFENRNVVEVAFSKVEFSKAVSLKITAKGTAIPTVDRAKLFDMWAGKSFCCER